jgi:ATP synthase F1 delta subunit
MAELTVDLTYGSALYQAAVETNKKDLILDEAFQVQDVFENNPDFFEFLNFPGISAIEKKDVLKNVFEGKICQELLKLLYVLTDKGRTARYSKIIKAYKDMVDREEGITYGTVYSVEPLKDAQISKLEEQLSALLQEKTKLKNELDPKLIGGFKILVDGRILDASIRKRLQDLGSKLV